MTGWPTGVHFLSARTGLSTPAQLAQSQAGNHPPYWAVGSRAENGARQIAQASDEGAAYFQN